MTSVITKVTFTTARTVRVVRKLRQRPAFLQRMELFQWLFIPLFDFNGRTNGITNCFWYRI